MYLERISRKFKVPDVYASEVCHIQILHIYIENIFVHNTTQRLMMVVALH